MRLDNLTINSNIHSYDVLFQKDASFISDLAKLENAVFVIDKNVWNHYGEGILSCIPANRLIVQEAREDLKNIDTVCELYSRIMDFAPRKNMVLVSMGGGIIQDITGFVASTLYRGIKWIFVPTTLLAQVDSCIGAKTSLNFNRYKNLVGSFFPPDKIYLYPGFLKTLTQADFYSGVGEMTKLHLMAGKNTACQFGDELPLICEQNESSLLESIRNCLQIKKSYIEDDEFDTGKRNLLNYGHCFGHAIESATDFAISHGQAVVVGMIIANQIALKKGILSEEQERFIYNKLLRPSLAVQIPHYDINATVAAMRQDKKNTGRGLALIMLKENYELIKIVDLSEEEAQSALLSLSESL